MKILYFLGMSLLINTAIAGPIYSSSCEEAKKIRIPVDSSGFFMSSDCQTAYVLPPEKGTTSVVGYTASDLGRCSEIGQFNQSLQVVNNGITEALKSNPNELKELYDQRKNLIDQYSDLSSTLGASVELNFASNIDNSIARYRRINPNLKVNFVSVALKNVKLAWNQTRAIDPDMNAVINRSISLPDISAIGNGSFNAAMDLSLLGACPLISPFTNKFPTNLKVKTVSGVVVPNLVYEYEIGANFKYHAEYNLGILASQIRQVTEKGGIFSTRSTSALIERAETQKWFKLDMECDDSRVCDQIKTETAYSIKQRLIAEVFDNVSVGTMGRVEAPAPGQSGAGKAADELKKCPNQYCQAAAVILSVADSAFGSKNKMDSYIMENKKVVKEDVNEFKPVSIVGVMGFGE